MKDIERITGEKVKWLNLSSFFSSCLPVIETGEYYTLQSIYYFTAYAYHRIPMDDKDVVKRHQNYIRCLNFTGVKTKIGRFKEKQTTCYLCHEKLIRHEEKETDVAMATKLFELLHTNKCDTVVIVTGDTDLAPAYRKAKILFEEHKVLFAFPYSRKNKELLRMAPSSFKLNIDKYKKNQFPNPVTLPNGSRVFRPYSW